MESHLQSATAAHLDLACVELNDTQHQLKKMEARLNKTQLKLIYSQVELISTKLDLILSRGKTRPHERSGSTPEAIETEAKRGESDADDTEKYCYVED